MNLKIAHFSVIMVNERHYPYYNYYYWFINLFFYNFVYFFPQGNHVSCHAELQCKQSGYVMGKKVFN